MDSGPHAFTAHGLADLFAHVVVAVVFIVEGFVDDNVSMIVAASVSSYSSRHFATSHVIHSQRSRHLVTAAGVRSYHV